jgi:hypothetical protein
MGDGMTKDGAFGANITLHRHIITPVKRQILSIDGVKVNSSEAQATEEFAIYHLPFPIFHRTGKLDQELIGRNEKWKMGNERWQMANDFCPF